MRPSADSRPRPLAPLRSFAVALLLTWSAACAAYDSVVESGGGRVHVYVEDADFGLAYSRIEAWIQRSADAVSAYFDRFPVDEAYVAVTGHAGAGVLSGIALGNGNAVVNIKLGLDTDERDLDDDWVLVHELVHLAFPKVHRRHHWAEEGLAVYVESVSRVQAGHLEAETLWRHFVDGMPNGLPVDGDLGLDNTPTWGRTYWGGALFYLLADVETITRTGGSKTLRDALRGIVDSGHSIRQSLELPSIYRTADRALGVTVLMDVYRAHAHRPEPVDLETLWRNLGIERTASGVRLRDDAKWSAVRERITEPTD